MNIRDQLKMGAQIGLSLDWLTTFILSNWLRCPSPRKNTLPDKSFYPDRTAKMQAASDAQLLPYAPPAVALFNLFFLPECAKISQAVTESVAFLVNGENSNSP